MPMGEWPIERTWVNTQQWPGFMDPARRMPGAPPVVYDPNRPAMSPEAARALETALSIENEVIWWAKQPPHQAPPFRAQPLLLLARAVLNAPSGSTLGVAGAASIAAAEGMIQAVTVYPAVAVAANSAQAILTFEVPAGHRAVIREWGARLGDSAAEAVGFQLVSGQPNPTGEVSLAAISDLDAPAPVCVLATERKKLQVLARNVDTVAPAFVQVCLKGWLYPVLQADDSERSSLSDNFGPNDNGRFARKPCT
jgi:hypothetical protein